jgi:hypothetical protein
VTERFPGRTDWRGIVWVLLAAGAFYGVSTAPGVFWGDSGEFQRRAATLELSPVARGYPLHRVLTWAAGRLVGSPALGANLVSAAAGAVAAALAHETGRRLSGSRVGGFAAAAALALCPTFWLYAGVAEVYTLLGAILLALLVTSRETARSPRAQIAFGALLGLSFLHHRMAAFAVPAFAVQQALLLRGPAAERPLRRPLGRMALGFAVGVLPFAVLCAVASRSPPPATQSPALWWFRDVFLGGDQNAAHLFGGGRRGVVGNALYIGKWLAYDLPGPALLLAGWGLARLVRDRARRADAWLFALLLPILVVFPFRYDWTGDQFSFLVPLCVVATPLVAVGVAALETRRGPRAARAALAAVVAAPLLVSVAIAFTPAGERLLPGLDADARRLLAFPVRAGHDAPERLGRARLAALPQDAVLHADWGDGQVYLYLQDVERVRPDVTVRIWYGARPRLLGGAREEWLAEMPGFREPSAALRSVRELLEPRGDGLWRVRSDR